jgi:nickel/cobalt exporter
LHISALALLVVGAAIVGVVHAVLPDHWVPLAVVGRAERWSLARVARVSSVAAIGHVLASIVLGGVVALVGLQFQKQIETQQGHIVGGILIVTGIGFLIWGMTGHGHPHAHDSPPVETHVHQHTTAEAAAPVHEHAHVHSGKRHSHRHSHEAFIQARSELIASHSREGTVKGLAAILVPFGVAASPDLSFLPLAVAASAYGARAVGAVLGAFAILTFVTFVGLTVVATAIGYQMRGEWLEDHATTITALVLIGIGTVAYFGL